MIESPVLSKRVKALGICAVFGALLAGPVMAKGLDLDLENAPASTLGGTAVDQNDALITAKLIVGHALINQNGERIGDIVDVVRDKVSEVLFAVVMVKPAGESAKKIAIPFKDVEVMPQEVIVRSKLDAEDYAAMPAYAPDAYQSVTQTG